MIPFSNIFIHLKLGGRLPFRTRDLVMKEYMFYRTFGWYLLNGLDYNVARILTQVHTRDNNPNLPEQDLARLARVFYRFRCAFGEMGDMTWEQTIRNFIPWSRAALVTGNGESLVVGLERLFLSYVREHLPDPRHRRHETYSITEEITDCGFTEEIEQECYACRNFTGVSDYTAVGKAIRIADQTLDYAKNLPPNALIQTSLLPAEKVLPEGSVLIPLKIPSSTFLILTLLLYFINILETQILIHIF